MEQTSLFKHRYSWPCSLQNYEQHYGMNVSDTSDLYTSSTILGHSISGQWHTQGASAKRDSVPCRTVTGKSDPYDFGEKQNNLVQPHRQILDPQPPWNQVLGIDMALVSQQITTQIWGYISQVKWRYLVSDKTFIATRESQRCFCSSGGVKKRWRSSEQRLWNSDVRTNAGLRFDTASG